METPVRFLSLAPGRLPARDGAEASFWRTLHYFHLYRLAVALLFTLTTAALTSYVLFPPEHAALGNAVVRAYLFLAACLVLVPRWHPPFNFLLTFEVAVDVAVLTALMYLGSGNRSGFSYMLLVVLAGAGLVGQGRLTLFYAAMASVAVLAEQGLQWLHNGGDPADFTGTGVLCMGFFGSAISAHLLSKRVVASETLARQRGEALAAQLRINEQVLRDMQDGVLVVDGAGRVLQHNPRAAELCAAADPSGRTLAEFFPELADHYAHWRSGSGRNQGVLLSPADRPLHVRYLPAGDGANGLLFIEDAEQLQDQARQIKLAALGRLTANMAHEIRNPLAAISHAAELLQDEGDGPVRDRLLRIIGENTGRLNRLVTDVLELGRRDKTRPEAIALAPFLAAFAEETALADPERGPRLEVVCEGEPALLFDRGHLSRVLTNLAGNALRHCSGAAGSVRIVARPAAVGRLVELRVEDDGPGMPAEVRGRIFEPFFTTRSNGTGLGLYIARELCEANGAALALAEGGGTCFRIVGPRA